MSLFANADVVVVRGFWLDEITGQGVRLPNSTASATVSFTPVPLSVLVPGAKTPNLRDISTSGWIKTRTRVATVNPVTGYFATLMVASNDPDLDAYGGRYVQFSGEDPFVIAVPYNASTVAADQAMVDALSTDLPDLEVGDNVKTVWLTAASLLTTPTPTPPNTYLTATQTLETIAAGLEGLTDELDDQITGHLTGYATTASLAEAARDALGTALVAGANVTITPNDGADTITIAASAGSNYTDEQAQDAFAALIAAGTHAGISFSYNDAGNAISATVAAQSWSQITGKPTFATVATSGLASDLSGTLDDSVIPSGIARDSEVTSAISAASTNDRARANHTGTQTSTTISDFTEAVQDAVAALLGAGSNITLNYDDTANTLTVTGVGDGTGLDAEAVRDAIGVALVGTGNIAVTVNDALDTITISTTATANDTDANLKNRANHTGTQAQSTVTNLTTDLAAKAPLASPAFTGTPTGITKTHVGLGSVDNTADTAKPVSTAQQTALDGKQALDSDLTAIAGLTATTNNFMQAKAGAWASRTPAQVKADLGVRTVFSVVDYGAVGGDATADTTAFQAAFDAAALVNGTVLVPGLTAGASYVIDDTLSLHVPSGVGQITVNIEAEGASQTLLWAGGNNKPVITLPGGIVGSRFTGIKMKIPNTTSGVIGWDVDTRQSGSGYNNTNSWLNCRIDLGTGVNNIGWRMDHVSGTGADISFLLWQNCSVAGGGNTSTVTVSGQRGWVNEGANTLNLTWMTCFGCFLEKGWTNLSDTGATSAQGGGAMFFYGTGGGYNDIDFQFATIGTYVIDGGRFELGNKFLDVPYSANCPSITVTGADISDYTPSNGRVFELGRPASLMLSGCVINGSGSDFTDSMIFMYGPGAGTLTIRGGGVSAADPCWSFYSGDPEWDVSINNVLQINNNDHSRTGKLANRDPASIVAANTQTASYTLVANDAGKAVEMNVGSANTLTIPQNSSVAFPIGTVIEVYQAGAGQCTVTAGSGVTLRAPGGAKTAAQYASASLRKRATNEWVLAGSTVA